MNRKHFFKTTILGGLSIIFLPLNSFHLIQKKYSKNELLGKENPDLTGDTYASKMNKEAKVAFEKMKTAALKDGINIEVVSAYRSFQKQKTIFENKYKKFTNEGLNELP